MPKKNGKWRVCIDYFDLNNACPKDPFPLPRIDKIVDATAEYELLFFMDAYSCYNQIPMFPPNSVKMAFITPKGMYCYKIKPFRLKNEGATYQHMMARLFEPLLGKSMEIYIDDMLVKSEIKGNHIRDRKEAFELMRQHHLCLNSAKCDIRVNSSKFLGHLVS